MSLLKNRLKGHVKIHGLTKMRTLALTIMYEEFNDIYK